MNRTAHRIVFFLTALMVIVVFIGCRKPETIATIGLEAPDFELKDPNGRIWRLSDMRGSVVLVNFWASWCDPCKVEMPSIERLLRKTMENRKFRLVTIVYKDDPSQAFMYVKQNNYNFPVLIDPQGKAASAYGLTGVPETFLIDGEGILMDKKIGPAEWDAPEVLDRITRLTKH